MSSWKTVERKANKKVKKVARDDDDYTSDDSNDDYRRIYPNNGNGGTLLSSYEGAKKPAPKRKEATLAQKAAAAAQHAEELEKRRQERKANAADAVRAKRQEAQEHAKRANDVTQWPTVAEALAEQSEAFMDHFDKVMEEDPIVTKGGIGALLAYAPSIFEKFLHRTQLLPEEASGEVLLVDSVESQAEDYPEALDTFVYYKSLLSKMPEIKAGGNADSIKDGLMALLSAVWGTKGLKNALAAKDTGRGATIALELTFDQLWRQGLLNIKEIAAMFVNPSRGEPHGPLAAANFHRIFAIMTNSANNSKEDKDTGRIAIARAAADLLTSGYLTALFGGSSEDTIALLEVIAKALRYVSTKQLTNKAYHGVNWKDALVYGEYIASNKLEGAQLSDSWSVITLELVARQNPNLAKTIVACLLDALEKELAGRASFSPAESVPIVVLSTIFALHPTAAIGPLKAHVKETPRAALVFLAVAKASKLFDVPAHLEEAVASAAKKAGAQAPKMNNNVKLADIPSAKAAAQPKKKAGGAATAEGKVAEKEFEQHGSPKAYLITFVVLGIAAAAAYYFKQLQSTWPIATSFSSWPFSTR